MEKLLLLLNAVFPLSEELKDYLIMNLKFREIKRKDLLLRAGHICRHIYFIESGLLRCFYLKDTTEVSTWFMKEGDVIISIESFYQQKESYEYIQAIEDCALWYLDYAELQKIYREYPEFNFTARVLTEKYYTLWSRQLYGLRMQQAVERYEWLMEQHPELILRVPSKYLASYLGISQPYLSMLKTAGPRRCLPANNFNQ